MPAVCRFYLKGYCRYGNNCRFEHPGETNYSTEQVTTAPTNFSFKTALSNIGLGHFTTQQEPQSPPSSTGFSFLRALQASNNVDDVDMSDGVFLNTTNIQQANPLGGIFGSAAYPSQQHSSFTGFATHQFQNQPVLGQTQSEAQSDFFSSFNINQTKEFSFASVSSLSQASPSTDKKSLIFSDPQTLSKEETEAFQGSKFNFRQIPIRPPPKCLCR